MSLKDRAETILSRIDVPQGQGAFKLMIGTAGDIASVKKLDDLAFGQHYGISETELKEIIDNGFLILLKDFNERLIGSAQLITRQTQSLRYRLGSNEAYAYGTAIHPESQGKGLGQLTGEAQRLLASEMGKDVIVLTVRVENRASLRSRFKQGFQATDFDPVYYGLPADGGSRVIMKKNITESSTPAYDSLALSMKTPVTRFDGKNFDGKLLSVPVMFGGSVDFNANNMVETLIKAGYKGVWVFTDGNIVGIEDGGQGLFVFSKENK